MFTRNEKETERFIFLSFNHALMFQITDLANVYDVKLKSAYVSRV